MNDKISKRPRLMVAGLKGGSGKTILALGLIRHLSRDRGMAVQPFKKGPDYIDAEWLRSAAASGGRQVQCYNLDQFLMDGRNIVRSFLHRSRRADISVIEGNRGLYDGMDIHGTCSTAELSKLIKSPVVLVMDVTKTTRTAAALALGCRQLDPEVKLSGVVLNQVGGPRHRRVVTRAIEEYAGLPVLGAIPRMKKDPLPMRHLGLTPAFEFEECERALDELARLISENVDIEAIVKMADEAEGLQTPANMAGAPETVLDMGPLPEERSCRIGILRDPAFQFYYPENLEALELAGAELVYLNALSDRSLPGVDALYIGGGFPETQADRLSANKDFMHQLRERIGQGLPVYAECGGLMYLGRSVVWKGRSYPMLDVLAWDFVVGRRPVGHGYSILEVGEENPYHAVGKEIRGHEFHYSRPEPASESEGDRGRFACRVKRGHGFLEVDGQKMEGIVHKNVFGTYTHIHGLENPDWARAVVEAALAFSRHGQEGH